MYVSIGHRDVEVGVHDAAASTADLARAAGVSLPAHPRPLAATAWWRGQQLDARPDPPAAPRDAPELAVVGGLDAGGSVALVVGSSQVIEVGRGEGCGLVLGDPAVSRRHARFAVDEAGRVVVADAGSHNGTWVVDGAGEVAVEGPVPLPLGVEVRVGASRLAGRIGQVDDAPVAAAIAPGPAGTVAHNRPPRLALPPPPAPVLAPAPPRPAGARLSLGVVAVLGPVLMAAAMVVLVGNPAFALLALLAPILAVGNHVEGRRRETKGSRREAARWADELAELRRGLAAAGHEEAARRRFSSPDPAEVARRAGQPSTRLWERRPPHEDWLRLAVGTGTVPWPPRLTGEVHGPRHPDLADAVASASVLADSPVAVELAEGGVVGVVGTRSAAVAVARWLVIQAAVHHGPADLAVLAACDESAVADWEFAKWLPHVEDPAGGPRRLAVGRAAADALAEARIDRARRSTAGDVIDTLLVLVDVDGDIDGDAAVASDGTTGGDGDGLLTGRRAPVRSLLDGRGGPVAGIVVASSADRLPAACTTVVTLHDDLGSAEVRWPALGVRLDAVRATGISLATADRIARAVARFDDPELEVAGAGLPATVLLGSLLGLDEPTTAAAIQRRWADGGPDPRPVAPLGVDAGGVVTIDLAADGPHALIAGTTGSGKSELLRSLVAGLAAGSDPDALTFVLVDFKGGSAFDACARLPHVVGLVTDLDADLAARALRCLEAELRHRERVLRAAGAPDLGAYRARRSVASSSAPSTESSLPELAPMPRLVVVVDEFATLRAELPEFVDALVGIAQRGRSLGVHLVLATQRPSGAVSDQIRANANLRIALRVQDPADSVDVVDGPEAAALPRSRPGRACVRLGAGEVLVVQTALATADPAPPPGPVEVRPFDFDQRSMAGPLPADLQPSTSTTGPTALDLLVDACAEAWADTGRRLPRRPWPDPLPAHLEPGALTECTDVSGNLDVGVDVGVVVGVLDDPDHQQRRAACWRPADGNLLVFGVGGSGTTNTLVAVAHALATRHAPDRLHLFVLDHGAGELAVLDALPQVAAVVGPADAERRQRVLLHLRAEIDRRRGLPTEVRRSLPEVVVLVDGLGGLLAEFDGMGGLAVLDAVRRLFVDGPEVGVRTVAAAERAGAVPAAIAATVRQRWVHRVADAGDAAALGVSTPDAVGLLAAAPGRFLDTVSGLLGQVARPADGWARPLETLAHRWPGERASVPDAAVRTLPEVVVAGDLGGGSGMATELGTEFGAECPWRIRLGLADHDLAPAWLPLHDGDHVLVAGPGRSGRTTALASIAAALLGELPDEWGPSPTPVVVVLAARRSWLATVPGVAVAATVGEAAAAVLDAARAGRPAFLLVDDAEGVDDVDGALEGLLGVDAAADPDANRVHVIAAGRAEVLRGLYGHWTRTVRRSRLGVLLRPDVDLDGELLGVALPRRRPAAHVPGRGYLVVDGAPTLLQVTHHPHPHPPTPNSPTNSHPDRLP